MIEPKQSVPPSQVTSGKPSASSGREQKERPASGARIGGFLLVTLALLAAAAPFATDLYLPAFPAMVDDLGTGSIGVQLSLTAFLVGVGVGQVMFGPLSDRIGRRGPLLVGTAVYVLAGAATALAPTIGLLVAARFVQGVSGAAGMVIGRAIIADLARGRQAARAFSVMMLVGGVAPVVAPLAGSLLAGPVGWRGLLWIVAAIGALALVAAALDQVRGASGMASAALGLLQFTFAGLAAPLVTLGGAGVMPLAATMLTASVVANVAFVIGRRPAPDLVPRAVPATPEPVLAEAVA